MTIPLKNIFLPIRLIWWSFHSWYNLATMPIRIVKPSEVDPDKVGFGRLHFHTFQGASPDHDQQPDQPTESQTESEPPKMRDYEDTDEYWPALIAYQRENDEDEDFWPDDEDVQEAFRRCHAASEHPIYLAQLLGLDYQKDREQAFSYTAHALEYLDEVLRPYTIYSLSVTYDMAWAPGYGGESNDVHRVYELPSGEVYVMYFNEDDSSFGLMPEGWTLDDVTERIVSNLGMFCGERWEGTTAYADVNQTWRDAPADSHGTVFRDGKAYPIDSPDYRRFLLGFPRESDADQSWRDRFDPDSDL